jgi:hypothetical protein
VSGPARIALAFIFAMSVGVSYLMGCRAGHNAGVAEQREEAVQQGAGRWGTHHKTGEKVFEYRSPEEVRRDREKRP